MKSVTISTYMMRVKNNRKDAEYYYLSNLPPGQSLFELLADYLDQLGEKPSNDTDNQFLLRASHIKKNGQSISGILERGEYGIKSALLDVKKREISYERSVSDAEMMPFYFLAVVPLGGTLILPR